jgi:hypothetical protein
VQWLTPAIPAAREREIRKVVVGSQPWQKVNQDHPPINRPGVVVLSCASCYVGGHRKEYHDLKLALGENLRPYLKNN